LSGQLVYPRIIVKLGTSTLTAGTTRLSLPRLVDLVSQMAALVNEGCQVLVVSSGAIAVGRERLNYPQLPKDIPAKQMLSSVGQPRLMAIYEQLFGLYGLTVAQVLLTRADLDDRRRYLNSRNTLAALLAQGVAPIINENDTVATEEIRFGDNDNLSALVASLIEADMLMLLTDQPGLLSADPRRDPNAQLINEVSSAKIPEELWQAAGGSSTSVGTGGMLTKLHAAELARRSGVTVVIAQGSQNAIITRLAHGERLGTWFSPTATALDSRKRYILAGKVAGRLTVDDGAAHALRKGGSLLPVGVVAVDGLFERGDTVRILDSAANQLANGLVNYASGDVERIRGLRSDQIEATLGYVYGDEVIHRDNMVVLG